MKFIIEECKEIIKEKEYVSIIKTLDDSNNLEFIISYNDEILEKRKLNKNQGNARLVDLFARRNEFKGVVSKVIENNIEIQVIRFADLHRHSGYSLLDGASKIEDMVAKTEYCGALTDHGVMFGVLDYYKQMKAAGKKPIIGFEAYSETIDKEKKRRHLILLAKNEVGFDNLIKLTSEAFYNFYKKPHVTYENLKKYSEGIVCTSACLGGEIPQLLLKGEYEKAKKVVLEFVSIFGKDDFYIEIQRHHFEQEEKAEKLLIQLARELGVKLVATTDSHYTNEDDDFAQEILLCLQTQKTINKPHMKFQGDGYFIHTSDEMEELFKDIPEALDNTLEIEEKCNLDIKFSDARMPKIDIPPPFKNVETYFEYLCREGFKDRFFGTDKYTSKEYIDRLNHEIKTIIGMGFPGYLLVVWDFINFAKKRGISVGPGRGSAVGSLVAYCLKITDLDPIPYNLLFERFLNPERVTMPDIDTDFEYERRQEVIDYVTEKYGAEKVSKIITFGTLAARMVVRDVARVLEFDYSLGDSISKAIPDGLKMTLKKALAESLEFKQMYDSDERVKKVVDIAAKLEGLPRHTSQHACGLVISFTAIDEVVPTILMQNEDTGLKETTTQFQSTELEERGLIKMDFLGLRTEGVISKALYLVNIKRAKEGLSPLTLDDMDLKDVDVYRFISKGHTSGIFQLESAGMTSFMKDLFKDTTSMPNDRGQELFERLIAGISLYRPGPMDSIPDYLKYMKEPTKIEYLTPELEPILKSTYGVLVYQEEVMQVVRDLAGYSMGRSDLVRRAMSKKKHKVMEEERKNFIYGIVENGEVKVEGCLRRGISEEVANKIFDIMMEFASYAFNKSHAAGYAVIGYQTAYLAYYYPIEFMTAILNSFILNSDKLKIYLSALNKKGIKTLAPDVNRSEEKFCVDDDSIRFGLMGLKNLGKSSVNIMDEKNKRGPFSSYQDFVERMSKYQKMDKKIIESLVYSGALDCFEGTRKAKLSVLQQMLNVGSKEKKDFLSGQVNMFEMFNELEELQELKTVKVPSLEEFDKKFKLSKEKEYAGFYVTEHPLDEYVDYLRDEDIYDIGTIVVEDKNVDDDSLNVTNQEISPSDMLNGKTIKIAGMIKNLKMFHTKKDAKPLYVFEIEDKTGEMKAVIFADRIPQNQDKLVEDKIVVIEGTFKKDDKGMQVIVKSMFDIESVKNLETPKKVWIKVRNNYELNQVLKIVKENEGNLPIFIRFNNNNMKSNKSLKFTAATFATLQNIFGENVKLIY